MDDSETVGETNAEQRLFKEWNSVMVLHHAIAQDGLLKIGAIHILHGNKPVNIDGFVHHSHAAFAEFLFYTIVRDLCANHEGFTSPCDQFVPCVSSFKTCRVMLSGAPRCLTRRTSSLHASVGEK